jgi:hypothetical protein
MFTELGDIPLLILQTLTTQLVIQWESMYNLWSFFLILDQWGNETYSSAISWILCYSATYTNVIHLNDCLSHCHQVLISLMRGLLLLLFQICSLILCRIVQYPCPVLSCPCPVHSPWPKEHFKHDSDHYFKLHMFLLVSYINIIGK